MVMHARKNRQVIGTGTIKEGANGREVLTMPFSLGPFDIVIIASVPDEGFRKFPFYVKFELHSWVSDIASLFKEAITTNDATPITTPSATSHANAE